MRSLALATLLSACTHPIAEPVSGRATADPARASDPRVVLDYMRTAIEARDAHALAGLYAADATLEAAGGRTVRGRAAIEAALREELAPASSIRIGFPRLWQRGNDAIVEVVFHATHPPESGMHDVGTTEVIVLTFDRDGKIARERSYLNQATLDDQAAGDRDADPIPVIPTTTEVHVAAPSAADAATIAWTHAAEAKFSVDEADATLIDEHSSWDCALGFHGTSRAQLAKALVPWKAAFPDGKLVATDVWPVGDYVILEEVFTGTQSGALHELPASNRPVTWHWIKIWQVSHGTIVHGWQWGNWGELERQITTPSSTAHKPACSVES